MKRVFDDYGGVVITVIAVVALIGLVVFLMSDTGVMSNAFSKITGQMVDKSEQVIDDVGSLVDRAPSVEELQEKYTFEYYSTLNGAVNDVNAGTIGANADVDKADAVAGIYTDKNGGINVVLLKDATEAATVSPAVDMTINLGGHVLSASGKYAIQITGGNVEIDGRLRGSAIDVSYTAGSSGIAIYVTAKGNAVVRGGSYTCTHMAVGGIAVCFTVLGKATFLDCDMTANSPNGIARAVLVNGNGAACTVSHCNINAHNSAGYECDSVIAGTGTTTTISNCKIKATTTDGTVYGVNSKGTTTVTNCDIEVSAAGGTGKTYGIAATGTATVTSCDIRAYSNYHKDGAGYSASSQGVYNGGTLTINDCYVLGTHSGLSNHGTLYVNGGTYEGYGHGGIYFSGTGTTAYVRNATLKDSLTMPDGYTATSQHNGAGFYIGGNVGMDNITVYMDNCKIYGDASQIVLRGTSGEQNNTLYISRSKLYDLDGDYLSVRIDNDTHKLYIGKGCNFTAENTTLPGAVVVTDEVYVQE